MAKGLIKDEKIPKSPIYGAKKCSKLIAPVTHVASFMS